MKYLVRTREEELWSMEYVVEADSADDAEDLALSGDYLDLYDEYLETTSREVLEIEPINEDEE